MKLVAWNCKMAFHRKLAHLHGCGPDVAVIAECAAPSILRAKGAVLNESSFLWRDFFGNEDSDDGRVKGLGVFAFGPYTLELDQSFQATNSIVMPVRVHGPLEFNLMAVWSYSDRKEAGRGKRPGPVHRALEHSSSFCDEGRPLIVAGDFNNNASWAHVPEIRGMATIRDALGARGLVSAYHWSRNVDHGREPEPTHYWREGTKSGHTYHIDYIFAPAAWAKSGLRFEMGTFEDWCGNKRSDHVPLSIELPDHVPALGPVTASCAL
jgi:exodeoxyribonuclease-3